MRLESRLDAECRSPVFNRILDKDPLRRRDAAAPSIFRGSLIRKVERLPATEGGISGITIDDRPLVEWMTVDAMLRDVI